MINQLDVTKKIFHFKKFLCDIAPVVDNLMDDHVWDDRSLVTDWIDINWELLIGKNFLSDKHSITNLAAPNPHWKYLSPQYRADYTIVAYPNKAEIRGPLKNEIIPIGKGLRFISFLSVYENRGYGFYPPFDIASLFNEKTRQIHYARIEELRFYAMPYEEYLNQLFYPETPRPGLL